MSAEKVQPFPSIISGATVVGVPHKVVAASPREFKILARPKSAIFIVPTLSNNMF